jgi:tetratricopeptide (TPR) repeat protein
VVSVNDLRLDPIALHVFRGTERLPATPQGVRVLVALAARRGEIVTRDELYAAVWNGKTHVDAERALNTIIRQLRIALGDTPHAPRYIETLQGRGYRLVPLRVAPPEAGARRLEPWRIPLAAGLLTAAATLWIVVRSSSPAPSTDLEQVPATARASFSFGQHLLRAPDAADRARAVEPLREALAVAPHAAPIRAHLAEALFWGRRLGEARREAERAYLEVPSSGHALYMVGVLRHLMDWDWAGGARALDSAIAGAPRRPEYLVARAYVAATAGDSTEAIALLDRAFAASPSDALVVGDLGYIWLYVRRPARALEMCRVAQRLEPRSTSAASCVFEAAIDANDPHAAATAARLLASLGADTTGARALAAATDSVAIRRYLREAGASMGPSAGRRCDYWCARILARAGRFDEALSALEAAVATRDPLSVAATVDPAFGPLAGTSRFGAAVGDLVRSGAAPPPTVAAHAAHRPTDSDTAPLKTGS